jgi:hypothetical protein
VVWIKCQLKSQKFKDKLNKFDQSLILYTVILLHTHSAWHLQVLAVLLRFSCFKLFPTNSFGPPEKLVYCDYFEYNTLSDNQMSK